MFRTAASPNKGLREAAGPDSMGRFRKSVAVSASYFGIPRNGWTGSKAVETERVVLNEQATIAEKATVMTKPKARNRNATKKR